ncbi:MAG: Zn-dependent alcohol dehydrogenase [Candidatus Nephthysia bennettiae]|uniref:Zn-dependent alcohol dehydrogenase n=1 Tax=Candidatus Nephthysia bennettiae TaxID=3127016 RepID=A0A934K2Y6_9BACT|nr:Zn-dependent alcohol dehydrogenase [Candidatus Dormibacteraeota bacterium]MBJ7614529.1 Zn-dependent alcohol dehydrogenase [Candidatus Dormibacteraeota bacterium]PZR97698.1 MAG: Zn-dependent alcohol dehydrogenase [Candidatus Dormibacteraeota bacterium]
MPRAAVLYEAGQPLRVEEVDLAPPQTREVRVRVVAAGVCHSDYHYMKGDLATRLPAVLGHEGAGVVEEVGAGVTTVAPGDHVVLLWRSGCGHCAYCATGRPALCAHGAALRNTGRLLDGTTRLSRDGREISHFLGVSCFAEAAVCPEQSVLKIDGDIPLEIAALAGCSVMTGVGAATNSARVEPGSSVLVIGAGGVGLCAIMGAQLCGAARVVAADLNPSKLRMAHEFGASDLIDASSEDVVKAVRELTGGGVDFAFEAIGRPETVTQALRALRAGGVAVAIGVAPPAARAEISPFDLVLQEKTLKGSIYGSTRPHADFPRLFELYRRGRLPLDRLLSRRYRLEEVNEAYDAMLTGEVARSVITFPAS